MVNYYITTDQDNIRKSKHALPYRCIRERARNANIASICTLKHGKKFGNEEVFNLVKDSIDGVI